MEVEIDEFVAIRREVRIEAVTTSRYIEPAHAIVTKLTAAEAITPQDAITTAVCWLVGKRPLEVVILRPNWSNEALEAIGRATGNPLTDQFITFMGMGGLMTLAKELTRQAARSNIAYLKLRWKALCATANIPNMWESNPLLAGMFDTIVDNLITWQAWVKPHTSLRRKLLNYALANTEDNALVRGALEQVKMVLQDYGLKSAFLMESFVTTGSRAIFLPAIAQQACALKKAMSELRALHGTKFPYMRVYPLDGVERVQHRLYPDLYYAAVHLAIKNKELGPEGQYAVTEVQTTIPKKLINEQMSLRYKVQPTLDEDTKQNLIELGIDPAAAMRRPRDDDEDEYEDRAPRRQRLQ